MANFIAIARKARKHKNYSGDDWFLGAVTDEEARTLNVSLDFLDSNEEYEAQVYVDAKDAHWENNPYAIEITKKTVSSKDVLKLDLAPSGGAAIRFKKL